MSLLAVLLPTAVILLVAYRLYGGLLARLFRLDPDAPTPAVTLRDDVDYEPIPPQLLLGQHFSAIAAAGPIVGPILAGVAFGWLPALIWIVVGSIFIGGVHDFATLVASIRHKARSIAEVVRDHMSRRAYVLFLAFVWIALVYIIVAFTDITAQSFVGRQMLENGESVSGRDRHVEPALPRAAGDHGALHAACPDAALARDGDLPAARRCGDLGRPEDSLRPWSRTARQ